MKILRTLVIAATLLSLAACVYPPRQGTHDNTPYSDENADERTAGEGVY